MHYSCHFRQVFFIARSDFLDVRVRRNETLLEFHDITYSERLISNVLSNGSADLVVDLEGLRKGGDVHGGMSEERRKYETVLGGMTNQRSCTES